MPTRYTLDPLDDKDSQAASPLLYWADSNAVRVTSGSGPGSGRYAHPPALFPLRAFAICCLIAAAGTTIFWRRYPYQTTIPAFLGVAFLISAGVLLSWYHVLQTGRAIGSLKYRAVVVAMPWRLHRYAVGAGSVLLFWWLYLLFSPTRESPLPDLSSRTDKYFIAADLYNNEAILPNWMDQMEALVEHLGRENVYISIYESNSDDATPVMLHGFGRSLADKGIRNRIISFDHDGRNWGDDLSSNARITYLARIRNIVLEPISSPDAAIRIPDWQEYTKIIYINDIVYQWQDIARLIGTEVGGHEAAEQEYDMACAIDHWGSGTYDIWVARDLCGTPFRAMWPYTNDAESISAIRREAPFEVSTCWNGAVVLNARPFLYTPPVTGGTGPLPGSSNDTSQAMSPHFRPRMFIIGEDEAPPWKMIDNVSYPNTEHSPALTHPLRFRTSGIENCVHSECFLIAYDLHRLAAAEGRRPRIWMNPTVTVAYEADVHRWINVILRWPLIKWWRDIWSHGLGFMLTDAKTERSQRARDQCTWAGLQIPTEEGRCPPLPGRPVDGDRVF